MKLLYILITSLSVFIACNPISQQQIESTETVHAENKATILKLMNDQAELWSNGNLEGFMEGYWHSDSLRFISSNGITYGWKSTLDNYKKNYPTSDHIGTLTFDINSIESINAENYFVVGGYHLSRKIGDTSGMYTLWFKKIKGKWKIIVDHSS